LANLKLTRNSPANEAGKECSAPLDKRKKGQLGVPKKSKSRNLHERLIVCIDDVLRFMEDADVYFAKDAKLLLQKTKKLTE
jgi:hypothetical protein